MPECELSAHPSNHIRRRTEEGASGKEIEPLKLLRIRMIDSREGKFILSMMIIGAEFLVIVLLWLLNSRRVQRRYRNGILANTVLRLSLLLFVFLGVQEIVGLFLAQASIFQ